MRHRRAIILVVLLLIGSFALRLQDITTAPGGFSQEELTGIRIIENIRAGTIFVFFDDGDGAGTESLYYAMSVTITRFVGDGLFGYHVFSLWIGLLTLALLFAVARRLFGLAVGLLSLTTAGIGLWPVMLARTATHNTLLPLLVLAVLWATTQAYYLRRNIYKRVPVTLSYTLLGVTIAVITYAHPTGFLAGIAVFLFALQMGRNYPILARDLWGNSAYALMMAIILGMPYGISVIRNLTISGPYVFWLERPTDVVALLESIGSTLLAFFWRGDSDPTHNIPGLPLTQLLEPIFLLVGLYITFQRRHEPNYFVLFVFFVLGLLPDMWLDGGPNFHMLAFVMPSMYMLIGIGIVASIELVQQQVDVPQRLIWIKKQTFLPWPRPLVVLVFLLIGVSFGVNVYRLQTRLLEEWPSRDDTQFAYQTSLGQIALYLDRAGGDTPTLICTAQLEDAPLEDFKQSVSDIQALEWMLERENIEYRVADCRNDVVLINYGQTPFQIILTDPGDLSVLPTPILRWFRLATAQVVEPSASGPMTVWQFNAPSAARQYVSDLARNLTLYYPRDASGESQPIILPLDFEGNLTLVGIDTLPIRSFYRPGDILPVTTYWQVDAPLSADVGVFIRLQDIPDASPYTETNLFEVDAKRLQPDDLVIQVGFLTIPQQLRPSEYLLTLGLYDGLTTNQQQVYDADTQVPRGTYVLIDRPFQVQRTP